MKQPFPGVTPRIADPLPGPHETQQPGHGIHPAKIDSLVSFWDFHEEAGVIREAQGAFPAALREVNGPIASVSGGLFHSRCAELTRGQYFVLPHDECGPLALSAELTVVAWVQRYRKPEIECEAVAGLWNETRAQRQYALFLDLRIHGGADNVCGHVSSLGGPTPGQKWCMDAAISSSRVPYFSWHCLAFRYDGREARTYLDGEFSERPGLNPYAYPGPVFQGDADFTVGAVHRHGEMGNWFVGRIGGLAVFGRALESSEIAGLAGCMSRG